MMANALMAPWFIEQDKAGIAEPQGLSLCETHERNGVAK